MKIHTTQEAVWITFIITFIITFLVTIILVNLSSIKSARKKTKEPNQIEITGTDTIYIYNIYGK